MFSEKFQLSQCELPFSRVQQSAVTVDTVGFVYTVDTLRDTSFPESPSWGRQCYVQLPGKSKFSQIYFHVKEAVICLPHSQGPLDRAAIRVGTTGPLSQGPQI